MTTIGAFEAKTHFAELLRKVEQGESFEIQRRGRPIAILAGALRRTDRDQLGEVFAFFGAMRKRVKADQEEIAEWKVAGRR